MRFPLLGKHLHQQIVIPLMAASLAVAIVAIAIGVSELSKIISQWIDGNIKQTMTNVSAHFEDTRQLQSAHASLLAQDERLLQAVRGGDGIPSEFNNTLVTNFLVQVRPAVSHDNIMLLGKDGKVVASTGELGVAPGSTPFPQRYTRWTSLGMSYTTLAAVGNVETVTSFSRVGAGTDYTLVLSDRITEDLLASSFKGLGSAFVFLDENGRFVARYVDTGTVGSADAVQLRQRLVASDVDVKAALAQEGRTFQELPVGSARYRMLAQPIGFAGGEDPAGGRGYVLAVVSTNVEEQAGAATVRLIGFWSVLAVVTLTGFGVIVARRVSGPLANLSETARLVAEGDFSRKVPIVGSNELTDLAESFNQMTDSLKQRTESITKKVLELATLYEMSRALGSTLELDTLLDSVLDSAMRIFNVSTGYVVMKDRDTEQLVLKAWRGTGGTRPDERAVRSSMCEWVAREGRPLIFNPPYEGETGGGQTDDVTGATAALCVPLISNEGIIGAVTVGSREPGFRFTSDDVRLLSTIANHATIAVGNIELFSSLQDAYIATVRALAAAVDAKDPYTRGHSERVSEYAMAIAERLELSSEQRTALEMAAYLHDIGKIGIREEILGKPGRLTDDEMAQMRHHPLIGANILKPVAFPWAIAPIVRHHHEHWDGRGYPAGLRGEEIPLLARILTAADAYEAMTSDRPYRRGRSPEEAVAELKRCSGTQFDPRVVDAFMAVLKAEETDRKAMAAQLPEEVQGDEARAIFVAVCDGMLSSFRRLGGPRLSANLESELNRFFVAEEVPFSFSSGRLTAKWNGSIAREAEFQRMRATVASLADGMARTSGNSLVDGFYKDAIVNLSGRMRMLAETMQLYRKP